MQESVFLDSICTARLFGRLATSRTDMLFVRVTSVFCKDGEALPKFLLFDTRVFVLCGRRTKKLLNCSTTDVASLSTYKTTLLLPAPMAASHLYMNVAQHLGFHIKYSPFYEMDYLILAQ